MPKFGHVTPILSVKNFPASAEHYTKVLGFKKKWDWGTPPVFGCVERNDVSIFLCQEAQGQPGTWIFIDVNDIDALHEEYKKSGAKIRQEPTNFPWGSREMKVEDIDGHSMRMAGESTGPSSGAHLC